MPHNPRHKNEAFPVPELPGETPTRPRRSTAEQAGRTTANLLEDISRPLGDIATGFGSIYGGARDLTSQGIEAGAEFGRGFTGVSPAGVPIASPIAAAPVIQRAADRGQTAAIVPIGPREPTAIPGIERVTTGTIGGAPLFTNIAGPAGTAGFGAIIPEQEAAQVADFAQVRETSPLFAPERQAEIANAIRARGGITRADYEASLRTPEQEQARAVGEISKGITRQLRQPGGIKATTLPAILQGLAQNTAAASKVSPSLSDVAALINAQTGVARLGQQATQATQRAEAETAQSEAKTFREVLKASVNPTTGAIDSQMFENNLLSVQQAGGFGIATPQQLTRQQAEAQLIASGASSADIKKVLDEQFPEGAAK